MSKRFLVNVVSLVPFSLGTYGLERAFDISQRAGFDGLYALPIKGWKGINDKLGIVSYEGAWNYGSLYRAVRRTLGIESEPSPTLIDWLLFGSNPLRILEQIREGIPSAYQVVHEPDDKYPLELSPEIGFTEHIDYKPGVVVDTYHIRRVGRHGEQSFVSWEYLFARIRNFSQVHVHLTNEEERLLFIGKTPSELGKMLRYLGRIDISDWVLEVKPVIGTKSFVIKRLETLRDNVSNIIW